MGQLGVARMVCGVRGKRTYLRSRRRPQSLFRVSYHVSLFGEVVYGLWVSESHIVGILKVVGWLKLGGIEGFMGVLEGDIATAAWFQGISGMQRGEVWSLDICVIVALCGGRGALSGSAGAHPCTN